MKPAILLVILAAASTACGGIIDQADGGDASDAPACLLDAGPLYCDDDAGGFLVVVVTDAGGKQRTPCADAGCPTGNMCCPTSSKCNGERGVCR